MYVCVDAPSHLVTDYSPSQATVYSQNFAISNANPLPVFSDGDRCLLTQELSSEASVEPCYLLNQRLWSNKDLVSSDCALSKIGLSDSAQLTRLEWSWGMEYNSLDPRSESNKIYRMCVVWIGFGLSLTSCAATVRRDWLKSFDSERWLLLPTPEMANKVNAHQDNLMRNIATQSSLPLIDTVCCLCCSSCDFSDLTIAQIYDGAETFEYRMLSLEDVELRSFNRIDRHDSSSGTSSPGKRTAADQRSTRHYPPFYTLPPLISRAKPHFVICDTAAKLHHWPTIGPVYSAKLRSVWHGHEFSPFSMTISMQGTYDTWFACDVPPSFASIPRVLVPIPPLYPYSMVAERTLSKACMGPCVNNRSVWIPTCCLRCSGWSRDFVDNPNSAHCDRYGNLKIGEQSNPMAQYRAHLGRVARYTDA